MKIKHILLFLMAWVSSMNLAYAQQTVVASGSVMDEKGELLIGVSISVKEVPSMGAITDIDGRFKIGGIKAGHTLVISYVGYDPQEIKMNKSDERMRVVLKESSNVMDEVVITASGKVQKKINVTGAITGVEVATLKTPATSISNMLGGRVPGIISVTRSGEPGKDFSEFWVRGISTFGAGQGALVLIDGIEGNLNTLDPEDIESFSILKDASSTAVYGVRGANGVVLVSTKKGKAGKLNLQVKANTGISYSPQMPKYVRAAEYAALANEAAVTRGRIPVYTDVDLALFRNHMDPDFHPDVDWRDVILKDYTWNQQYFLSASGGGEVARYYISAGFTTKDAIFKQDKGVNKYNTNVNYNKFNFRANVDVNVTPTQAILFPDGDRDKQGKVLSLEGENIHYTFKKKEIPASRTFLLQTVYDGKISNRYFRIPELSKNFDVAFFPEGGHAAQSTTIKMAFKAIDADGLSTEIEGQVLDEEGQVCADFKSQHLGMGSFRMYYVPGKKYHAVCSDGTGVSQRFDLPEPSPDAISLNTLWSKDYLRVSLSKSPDTPLGTSLTLVAHLRGIVLYAQPWDNKQSYVDFEKNFFPAGIVHFLLVDEGRNILSERLVFSLQKSALVQTEVRLDRENYLAREKVDMDIQIKDINGNPMSGNFALAVVDRTDVKPDTVSNIVSTLLLTSDLKGHIESPLSYLQDSRSSSYALDLLMMTQGWRKYNIPEVLKGNITDTLPYNLELGDEVSGKVEGLFSALKEGNISLLALKDSLIGTELAKPDRNGRFVFDRLEYPSGTQYIVQALSKKGSSKVFIELDPYKSFPAPKIGFIPRIEKPHIEENYMAKMDQKYTIENGMRVYNLAEVIVTARRERAVKTESPFYSVGTSKVLTEEDVKKGHFISTYDLLRRLPGITVTNNEVRYRFAPVMVLLDNVPEENFDFDLLDVDDIKDVFYSPATSVGPLYGSAAGNGAIVVTTKNGFVQKNKMNSNIQTIASVGYQQTVEFYSPAYDTKAKKESTTPDLRSTIYWNPSVQVDESGTAHVSFYTADSAADYGVVIEGVCTSGNLIYSGEKIVLRHNASY